VRDDEARPPGGQRSARRWRETVEGWGFVGPAGVQLGLANFQSTRRTQWSLLMAGNVAATTALITFFLAAQRQFIATMTLSCMKG